MFIFGYNLFIFDFSWHVCENNSGALIEHGLEVVASLLGLFYNECSFYTCIHMINRLLSREIDFKMFTSSQIELI